MTRTQRIANLGAAIVPFVAVIVAAILSWNHVLGWSDLVVFAVMYLLTGIGVTVGFHRLLTARSRPTGRSRTRSQSRARCRSRAR
jgi:stearoyl-CoA desaturase (delta-9 desaturase)